jgi:hypothetical protein
MEKWNRSRVPTYWSDEVVSNMDMVVVMVLADHPAGIRPTILKGVDVPDYRRLRVQGGTYFFTVNLLERRLDLLVRHVDLLREAVRLTKQERPFHINAWVVLPDHMHTILTIIFEG